jgi:hypothetical protein
MKNVTCYHASWQHFSCEKRGRAVIGQLKAGVNVLGIDDPWIWGVYILCILSMLLCVIYGIANWNKGSEREAAETSEGEEWEKEEEDMEKKKLGM